MNQPTTKEVLELAVSRLTEAGCPTPRLDAEVLLAHALNKDRTWLYMHPLQPLAKKHLRQFHHLLTRRANREPVPYITGHQAFFALEFQVNPHVLIPRPETELLVETALQIIHERATLPPLNVKRSTLNVQRSSNPQPSTFNLQPSTFNLQPSTLISIADIGTGSGCIAIALAKNLPTPHLPSPISNLQSPISKPQAHLQSPISNLQSPIPSPISNLQSQVTLFALDISQEALHLARQNATRHGVAGRITFLAGDLLQPLAHPVDLIVSNPPYVCDSELATASISPEVSRYEPRLALAGGPDGLDLIRQLLPQARPKLKPGGSLLVEIGASQAQLVTQLATTHFPSATIHIKKDGAGLDRLLVVKT